MCIFFEESLYILWPKDWMWINGHKFRVLTSKLKKLSLIWRQERTLKCSLKCCTSDWKGSGHGPLLLPTHINAPICLRALAALSPGPQTGSTSYVLPADCRLHTQTHTHSMGCAPNPSWRAQGELVRATLSCWMFHWSFHLISSSVKTGIPKNEHFLLAGEARLWGGRGMSLCTCSGWMICVR